MKCWQLDTKSVPLIMRHALCWSNKYSMLGLWDILFYTQSYQTLLNCYGNWNHYLARLRGSIWGVHTILSNTIGHFSRPNSAPWPPLATHTISRTVITVITVITIKEAKEIEDCEYINPPRGWLPSASKKGHGHWNCGPPTSTSNEYALSSLSEC